MLLSASWITNVAGRITGQAVIEWQGRRVKANAEDVHPLAAYRRNVVCVKFGIAPSIRRKQTSHVDTVLEKRFHQSVWRVPGASKEEEKACQICAQISC